LGWSRHGRGSKTGRGEAKQIKKGIEEEVKGRVTFSATINFLYSPFYFLFSPSSTLLV
jgi:hypothetical protein